MTVCFVCVSHPSPIMENRSSNTELWVNIACKYEDKNGCVRVRPAHHGCMFSLVLEVMQSLKKIHLCPGSEHIVGTSWHMFFQNCQPVCFVHPWWIDCAEVLPAKSVTNVLMLTIIICIFKAVCKHKLIEESSLTKKSHFCLFDF